MRIVKRGRDEHTFESFITDEKNSFAKGICMSLDDIEEMNLILLLGPAGSGKTHLLDSIYNNVTESASAKKITCVCASDWMTDFTRYCLNESVNTSYEDKYYYIDYLLIDNLDSLLGRPSYQAELARLIRTVCSNGCKVVLASCADIKHFDSLYKNLFRVTNNLVLELNLPGREIKSEYAERLANDNDIIIPKELFDKISDEDFNFREIAGFINKTVAEIRQRRKNFDITIQRGEENKNGD